VSGTRAGGVLSEFARARWLLAAFVLASLLPLVYPSLYWLTIICYLFTMGVFALSYDLVLGRSGVLSFGHAACFGLGAYAVYWIFQAGYPFWLGVATAMLLGAVTNVAMGTALRRVKGVYFAMFTLAFAEIIYLYLEKQTSITGGSAGVFSPRPDFLQAGDVRCLQALGALGDFEFHRLAFVQRLIPVHLNRGEVDENVFAGLALDESVAFAGIEPLHCSLFFHGVSFLLR
jgi:ABC-type branched-subunit amino acid transport system permease subunit